MAQESNFQSSVIFLIGSLHNKMVKDCDRQMHENKFPVDMDQLPVIVFLHFQPKGTSQQQISLHLRRDKASIHRTVSFLSRNNIVKVEQDTSNKRATIVQLTETGKKIACEIEAFLVNFNSTFIAPLTVEEQTLLLQLISKLMGPTDEAAHP